MLTVLLFGKEAVLNTAFEALGFAILLGFFAAGQIVGQKLMG
jgi:hypothetical protein